MKKIIITLALGSVISCSGGGWSSAQKDYYVDICKNTTLNIIQQTLKKVLNRRCV